MKSESSPKPLQSIPFGADWFAASRIGKTDLFEGQVQAPAVTGLARHYQVFGIVRSAAGVRHEMIVGQPERLKARVLIGIARTPPQRIRIGGADLLPNLRPDNGDAAEAAMVTVAFEKTGERLRAGHAQWAALFPRKSGQWIGHAQGTAPWSARTPEGCCPLPDHRKIRRADKGVGPGAVSGQVGGDGLVEKAGGLVDLGDGFKETGAGYGTLCHSRPKVTKFNRRPQAGRWR